MITEQGFARVRGVLRRRRLPIVAVAVVSLAAAVVVIGKLQPRYRAAAVVRALEAQPAREYVTPTVAEPLGERLKTLRLGLLARPLLGEVGDELGMTQGKNRDQVVDGMRSRLEVKVEGEDTFLITYEDSDPARAQQVVNGVARRFMDRQVAYRRDLANATTKALADEVERLRPAVEKSEKALRDFKLAHYGSLPEQQEQNLRMLDQTTVEVNIQETNLDLGNEHRRQLIIGSFSPMRHQEEVLLTQLHEVRTKYVADHPEVRRVEKEYSATKAARIEEERTLRAQARAHNPELVSLEGELQRTQAILAGLRSRQEELRRRVNDTAKNGQVVAALQADYDAIHGKQQNVISRLRDAELSSGLERGLANLRYDLVESASLPSSSVFPNRPLLGMVALLLCLGLSLSVGFALDRADSKIYSPAELVTLDRPIEVLACIPDIEGGERRSNRPRPQA